MGSKLGAHIQTKENMEMVAKESWKFGREKFIPIGMQFFKEHPEEVEQVVQNMKAFNLNTSEDSVQRVLKETVVHYYEKLFVLTKQYEAYWIVKNRVEVGDSLNPVKEALQSGKGVFIGQSHFGVTYFLPTVFMVHDISLFSVGYFPPPVGDILRNNTSRFAKKYDTGTFTIVNLAEEKVSPPLVMLQNLNQSKAVMNVFDEYNSLCKTVEIFGVKLKGGTGMDQILNSFSNDQLMVITPFLMRTSNETFKLEVDYHDLSSSNIIQDFFTSLQKRVAQYPEQWYFLQEVSENLEAASN